MRKITRKIAACAVASLTTMSLLAGCGEAGAAKLDGSKAAATIDGTDIPMGILSLYTRYQQGNQEMTYNYYSQIYGMQFSPNWDSADEETGRTNGQDFVDSALDQLKIMYLSKEKASDYGVELSDEITSSAAEYAKAFMEANSDEAVKLLGVTEEQVKDFLELEAYTKLVQDALYEEAPIEITDDEVNQSSFTYVSIGKTVEEEAVEEEAAEDEAAEEDAAAEEDTEDAAAEEDTADAEEEPELTPEEKADQLLALMLADPAQDMDEAAKSIDETLYAYSDSFTTVKAEVDETELEEAPEEEASEESAEEEASEEEAEETTEEAASEEEAEPAEEDAAADDTAEDEEVPEEEEYEVEETDASGYPLALIDALRGLSDGEVVPQVIETTDNYYVARLDLAFDEDATESAREDLKNEQQSDYYTTTTDEWVEKCEFSANEDVIKALVVSDSQKINLVLDPEEEETEEESEEETEETEEESEEETEETEEESEEETRKKPKRRPKNQPKLHQKRLLKQRQRKKQRQPQRKKLRLLQKKKLRLLQKKKLRQPQKKQLRQPQKKLNNRPSTGPGHENAPALFACFSALDMKRQIKVLFYIETRSRLEDLLCSPNIL